MQATNTKATESVCTGEGSTSEGPLCSLFISARSPVAQSGGEPLVSKSRALALVSKKEGQDMVG